mmetsp:Transcript_24973/g.77828  ORF Transcript_24973/g.77828 Transcript_24973/m.77828 type:complete len:129 (+) Transcript_24973:1045-1431(+)
MPRSSLPSPAACCWQPSSSRSGFLQGYALSGAMFSAFFVHFLLHIVILDYVVPKLGHVERHPANESYADCAAMTPATWFSTNPVHCLRSKYVLKDEPPQGFFVVGKEHLLKKNPKIGAYYEVSPAKAA